MKKQEIVCLHLKGKFYFKGNMLSKFTGPIKKGLRLVFWGNSDKRATSCVFLNDVNCIIVCENDVEIIILSPLSIDKEILIGGYFFIGLPGVELATFQIENIMGPWLGNIPSIND